MASFSGEAGWEFAVVVEEEDAADQLEKKLEMNGMPGMAGVDLPDGTGKGIRGTMQAKEKSAL